MACVQDASLPMSTGRFASSDRNTMSGMTGARVPAGTILGRISEREFLVPLPMLAPPLSPTIGKMSRQPTFHGG